MPGSPDPARLAFFARADQLEQRIRALETQQQLVISDPRQVGGSTGNPTGDPAHHQAVAVIGNLTPITNLTSISTGWPLFGIASYKTGSWVQL